MTDEEIREVNDYKITRVAVKITCPECKATGKRYDKAFPLLPCPTCAGTKEVDAYVDFADLLEAIQHGGKVEDKL